MNDPILESFLARQLEEGAALASASDLVELQPLGTAPVQRYIVRLRCRGLVRLGDRVLEHDRFDLGIHFPSDYLRRVDPLEVLTLLGPVETWHPNCRAPGFCPGHLAPGTTLVELIHQCVEILSWRKVTMREDDCMNPAACAWARSNRRRFPVDDRPLRRRSRAEAVSRIGADGSGRFAFAEAVLETVAGTAPSPSPPRASSPAPPEAPRGADPAGSPAGPARAGAHAAAARAATLLALCAEAGHPATARSSGLVVADLDVGEAFRQAEITVDAGGTRLAVEIAPPVPRPGPCREALADLLRAASGTARLACPWVEERSGEVRAGFEIRLPPAPDAVSLGQALSALAALCRACAREAEALGDENVAREYLAARIESRGATASHIHPSPGCP